MAIPTSAAALTAVALIVCAATVEAQRARGVSAPKPRFELALALPSVLVEDANGTTIRTGFAPVLGLAGTWMMSPKVQWEVGLRGSFASVTADDGPSGWSAGRSSQVAVRAALEQFVTSGISVSAGGSGTWFMGPEDVVPFRDNAGLRWGGDLGVSWRAFPARRVSFFGALEGFMVGGSSASDPIESPAWVRRFLVGLRRG